MREFQHQAVAMRGDMAFLLATNDVRFLKGINEASVVALATYPKLQNSSSLQGAENINTLKQAGLELTMSQKHLSELNQDFERGDTLRQSRSAQLLLSDYQLLIADIQELDASLESAWSTLFIAERYVAYSSFSILLLASVLMGLVFGRWIIDPFIGSIKSISEVMSVTSETAELIEGQAVEQHSKANQAKSVVESLTVFSNTSVESASKNLTLSSSVNQLAVDGMEGIEKLVLAVNALQESMKKILGSIELAQKSSESIGRIATSINDQSEEISMLSINAGILAVNAGEYGAGFMVIADEIGKLSALNKTLSEEARGQIDGIKGAVLKVFKSGEEGGKLLNSVDTISVEISSLFSKLLTLINEVSENSKKVTADMSTQAGALSNMSDASQLAANFSSQALEGIHETKENVLKVRKAVQDIESLL